MATASTYTLVAADQGTTVKVTVSFTDDANNPETLTSAATATVRRRHDGRADDHRHGAGRAADGLDHGHCRHGLTTPNGGSGWTARRADIASANSRSTPTWARPSRCG